MLSLSLFETSSAQTNVTPDQWLASQAKPNFAPGSHLPPLTKDGWPLSSNLNVIAAQYFGYALDLGEINPQYSLLRNMTNPGTFEYGMVQLANNDPAHFKLSVHTDRQIKATVPIPSSYWCTNAAGWFTDGFTNWQYITNTQFTPYPSPECPDTYWQSVSTIWGNELQTIRSNAPLAVILNDGEYGMQELGDSGRAWSQDPRVLAKAGTNTYPSPPYYSHFGWWTHYAAVQKSHQLGMQTAAFRQAVPDRQLYIYYDTACELTRVSANPVNCNTWGFDSTIFVTNSDLPSFQCYYYGYANYDYTNESASGDLLTEYLNCVGFNLKLGYRNNYTWVNGGSAGSGGDDPSLNSALSSIPLYSGFLKCLYTGGMVGGIAGYFSYPTNSGGFNATFPTNSPPHWLQQIAALSHVHALFSHFENVLTNGDLLSGPQPHRYSLDQPAYEFTNTAGYLNDRVLARKGRGTNLWLVTAWAADGTNRNVTVVIPTVGALTVTAADIGSVYQITMSGSNVQQTLLDEYSSFAPAPPTDLRVIAP